MKKDANKPQEANIEEIKAQELRPEKKQRDYAKLLRYGGFNTALIIIV